MARRIKNDDLAATQAALANALGVTRARISHMKKAGTIGEPPYSIAKVKEGIAERKDRRGRQKEAAGRQDLEALDILRRSDSTPYELASAAVCVVARLLADDAEKGELTGRTVDSLKNAMAELRKNEKQYLELAVKKRDLIERTTAKEVAGKLASKFVDLVAGIQEALSSQIEIWLEDEEFRGATTEDRRRITRLWIADHNHGVRERSADELEQMIKDVEV